MILSRYAREWARWPVEASGASSVEVYLRTPGDTGEPAWQAATLNGDGSEVSLLVAGPDADPASATVLPTGRTRVLLRFAIGDEVPVRDGGVIDVQ